MIVCRHESSQHSLSPRDPSRQFANGIIRAASRRILQRTLRAWVGEDRNSDSGPSISRSVLTAEWAWIVGWIRPPPPLLPEHAAARLVGAKPEPSARPQPLLAPPDRDKCCCARRAPPAAVPPGCVLSVWQMEGMRNVKWARPYHGVFSSRLSMAPSVKALRVASKTLACSGVIPAPLPALPFFPPY